MSLIVVASALLFRNVAVPFAQVMGHYQVVLTLLLGSLPRAWFGADAATRLSARALHRVMAVLLIVMALVLVMSPARAGIDHSMLSGTAQTVAGLGSGLVIGVVTVVLGVAGGRVAYPHAGLVVRTRDQARWQSADNAGCVCPLQPR